MSLVLVASQNPIKIEATQAGFARIFPAEKFSFRGISVPSGVSAQPMSRAETLQGARNRLANLQALHPEADYLVGIEGGVEEVDGELEVFAWVLVQSSEKQGKARTGAFYLPTEIAQLVRDGMELGEADDVVFGRNNSKQETGSIGLLTDDAMTRTSYYVDAVIMALIPFKNPQLTWK